MSSILFTDADGTWRLHNAKPFPGGRLSGWTPDSSPVGDRVARQSDGLQTMFRLRTDYAVSFSLTGIPARRNTNLVLHSENLAGAAWTASGTPTIAAGADVSSGFTLDRITDNDGASVELVFQAIGFTGDGVKSVAAVVKKGSSSPASGSAITVNDTTAGALRLDARFTWDSNNAPVVTMATGTLVDRWALPGSAWRLLMLSDAVTAANSNVLTVQPARVDSEQGNILIGALQADNGIARPSEYLFTTTAARSNITLVDVADRLRYHLLNGGTCQLFLGDAAGGLYSTCALRPGTTPSLQLSDRRAFEYTLDLQLLNVDASPTRFTASYADQ